MNNRLQETRSILEKYIQKNYNTDETLDVLYLQSDAKTAQQKEADRYQTELMKPQILPRIK